MEFVRISAQHFLAIMSTVHNFAATSQTFVVAHTVMAQQMTHMEAILAQIQEHLGLPPIPPTAPTTAAPTSPTPPTAPTVSSADPGPAVPLAALAALPDDHPTVPSHDEDEDEVPPRAPT